MNEDFGFINQGVGGGSGGTNYWSISGSNITPNTGSGISVGGFVGNSLATFNSAIDYKVIVLNSIQTSNTYTILSSDYIISVGAGVSNPLTIVLPSSPILGRTLYVKDEGLDASVNNITIDGNGNTIDGALTFTMNVELQSVMLTYNGTEWMVLGDANTGGGGSSYWTPVNDFGIQYFSGNTSTAAVSNIGINGLGNISPSSLIGVSGTFSHDQYVWFYQSGGGYPFDQSEHLVASFMYFVINNTTPFTIDTIMGAIDNVANYSDINIYVTNQPVFDTTTLIYTEAYPFASGGSFTLTTPYSMTSGAYYFWITYVVDGAVTYIPSPYFELQFITLNGGAGFEIADGTNAQPIGKGFSQDGIPLISNYSSNPTQQNLQQKNLYFADANYYFLGSQSNGTQKIIQPAMGNSIAISGGLDYITGFTGNAILTSGGAIIEADSTNDTIRSGVNHTFLQSINLKSDTFEYDSTGATDYTMTRYDCEIAVTCPSTNYGNATIYLPDLIGDGYDINGRFVIISDGGVGAGTNPIFIDGNGNLINGSSSPKTISTDWGSTTLVFNSRANTWIITSQT